MLRLSKFKVHERIPFCQGKCKSMVSISKFSMPCIASIPGGSVASHALTLTPKGFDLTVSSGPGRISSHIISALLLSFCQKKQENEEWHLGCGLPALGLSIGGNRCLLDTAVIATHR
jgi:hypothetical protein